MHSSNLIFETFVETFKSSVSDIGSPKAITAGGDQSFCGYIELAETVELTQELSIPVLKPIKQYQNRLGGCCHRVKNGSQLPVDVIDDLSSVLQGGLNLLFL